MQRAEEAEIWDTIKCFWKNFPFLSFAFSLLPPSPCISVRRLKSLPSRINILGRKCFSGRQEELAPARSGVVTSLWFEIFHCQLHSAVSGRLSKPISRPVSPPQLPPSLHRRRARFLFLTLQDVAPARSLGAHGKRWLQVNMFLSSARYAHAGCVRFAYLTESQGQVAVMERMLVFLFLAPDWADEESDGGQTLEII